MYDVLISKMWVFTWKSKRKARVHRPLKFRLVHERQLKALALNWFSQKATFRNGPSFLMLALYMEKGPGLTPFPSVYLKFV